MDVHQAKSVSRRFGAQRLPAVKARTGRPADELTRRIDGPNGLARAQAVHVGIWAAPSRHLFDQRHLSLQLRPRYEEPAPPMTEHLTATLVRLEAALTAQDKHFELAFRRDLIAAVPNLMAFAVSLARNPDEADDLVQETLLRGWNKRVRFQRGTNVNAWLFTILRNAFFSQHRRRKFEVADIDGSYAAKLTLAPPQQHRSHLQDVQTALSRLSADQQQALLLVAAEGHSYGEAAAIEDCAVGTIKSRVNRARRRLGQLLSPLQLAPALEPGCLR